MTGFLQTGGFNPEHACALAVRMRERVAHRGPDDGGVWVDGDAGIALAHRRLSILDLSPTGHQPMVSHSGRFVVAFNGEIYNHLAVRRELEGIAPVAPTVLHDEGDAKRWRGRSDTETLLAGFETWGLEATLRKAVGMFAIALWDRAERTLTLARDRMGEKPLYYGWQGDTFLFGSELKALKVHPAFQGEINRDSLALMLRHNYIPTPYSIYRGIHKLPPATYLKLAIGDRERQPVPYWSVCEAVERGQGQPFVGDASEAISALEGRLLESVGLQMIADVPLGAFLSGGIDSSTIVALMQKLSRRPVKTFTIGFAEQAYNEAQHAKAVALHLGTDHTELYVTPDEARAVIPRLPALYDEPFADSSQIPTFLVSQMARQHVTVSLSGDAGDELFGGYNRYSWAKSIWRVVGRVPAPLRKMAAGGLNALPQKTLARLYESASGLLPLRLRAVQPLDKLRKLAEILAVGSPEELYRSLVSHWKQPTDIAIGAAEARTVLTDRSSWPAIPEFERRMMYLDSVSYLPDDILVKVDRAAMGVSLETRVPFLDHRVVELAWRLPLSLHFRNGQGKWILRQLLHKYVPRRLFERPKMGFGVPIDSWLRGPLKKWAEDLLDPVRLVREGFFNSAPIQQKWKEHLSGQGNWQYYLWDVLMFQAWLEQQNSG